MLGEQPGGVGSLRVSADGPLVFPGPPFRTVSGVASHFKTDIGIGWYACGPRRVAEPVAHPAVARRAAARAAALAHARIIADEAQAGRARAAMYDGPVDDFAPLPELCHLDDDAAFGDYGLDGDAGGDAWVGGVRFGVESPLYSVGPASSPLYSVSSASPGVGQSSPLYSIGGRASPLYSD